jgi:hypothetical protein
MEVEWREESSQSRKAHSFTQAHLSNFTSEPLMPLALRGSRSPHLYATRFNGRSAALIARRRQAMKIADLVSAWRESAATFERYGATAQATTLRECAAELVQAIEEADNEVLSLQQAASESGYASRTLRQMLAEDRLPNAGRKNAPAIRRRDLPKRARSGGDSANVVANFFS